MYIFPSLLSLKRPEVVLSGQVVGGLEEEGVGDERDADDRYEEGADPLWQVAHFAAQSYKAHSFEGHLVVPPGA